MSVVKVLLTLCVAGGAYAYVSDPTSFGRKPAMVEHVLPSGEVIRGEALNAAQIAQLKSMGLPTEGAIITQRSSTVIDASGKHDPSVPFVRMPTPDGHGHGQVVVFAPANCSAEEGRRADDLMRRLEAAGIPATRASEARIPTDGLTHEDVVRMNSVMMGSLPAVFVNGTGKANPTFDEVAAQFKRTGG